MASATAAALASMAASSSAVGRLGSDRDAVRRPSPAGSAAGGRQVALVGAVLVGLRHHDDGDGDAEAEGDGGQGADAARAW